MSQVAELRPEYLTEQADYHINVAKQFIVNATIKLPEYSSAMYRHQQVQTALEALKRAELALAAQIALENMKGC